MAEAGPGKIRLWNDFLGPEIPVANAVAYGTSAGGCNYYLGDYSLKGELGDTDAGVVALGIVNGAVRLGGNDLENKGVALTTDLVFSPTLQGPIVLEARVQMRAVTTRNIFVGFTDTIIDDVVPPTQSDTITHTLTAAAQVGFHIDTSLDAGTTWHAIYNGGTTTGQTVSTSTTTGIVAVAGEWDVLRLEIDTNATVRFWINGKLESTVTGAISTSTLQGALVGCWGTTTTTNDMDVDYLLVKANRDWTR